MRHHEAPARRCSACGFELEPRARHCKMCYAPAAREKPAKRQEPAPVPEPVAASDSSWGSAGPVERPEPRRPLSEPGSGDEATRAFWRPKRRRPAAPPRPAEQPPAPAPPTVHEPEPEPEPPRPEPTPPEPTPPEPAAIPVAPMVVTPPPPLRPAPPPRAAPPPPRAAPPAVAASTAAPVEPVIAPPAPPPGRPGVAPSPPRPRRPRPQPPAPPPPTELGGVPWTQPPVPPPPPDPRRRQRVLTAVAAVVALVAVTTAGAKVWSLIRPSDYPDGWDERVDPIADIVAQRRGLEFDHPVPVDFQPAADFDAEIAGGIDRLPGGTPKDVERFVSTFRALGLVDVDADSLVDSFGDLAGNGRVLAYYDTSEERIVVRGEKLDTDTKVTLAHELTHALDDQHFDLDRLAEGARDAAEQDALRALGEGNAVRTQLLYLETLSERQQTAVLTGAASDVAEHDASLPEGVPELLRVRFGAPYELGPPFVDTVAANGEELLDEAFRSPPTTDEHIIDPSSYLRGDEPEAVARPPLVGSERRTGSAEPFGALSWYYLLASRIDPRLALDAVDGWGGDVIVPFERSGAECVRLAVTGDTGPDTDELATALQAWASTMPPGAVTVTPGDHVTVSACDVGAAAPASGAITTAHEILVVRSFISALAVKEGCAADTATEGARALALDPDARATFFSVDPTGDDVTRFRQKVAAVLADCV